jgi:hypothetical protein
MVCLTVVSPKIFFFFFSKFSTFFSSGMLSLLNYTGTQKKAQIRIEIFSHPIFLPKISKESNSPLLLLMLQRMLTSGNHGTVV